ncbi:hypothetical protein D3C84_553170 [compost metagenome]
MQVVCALLGQRGLVAIVVAPRRLVVMAHEQPGRIRQLEQLADRAEQQPRIATGEIATGGAVVGHEQGVADEGRIADHIGHAGRGMPGRMDGAGFEVADPEALAVTQQAVELAAIGGELGSGIE